MSIKIQTKTDGNNIIKILLSILIFETYKLEFTNDISLYHKLLE